MKLPVGNRVWYASDSVCFGFINGFPVLGYSNEQDQRGEELRGIEHHYVLTGLQRWALKEPENFEITGEGFTCRAGNGTAKVSIPGLTDPARVEELRQWVQQKSARWASPRTLLKPAGRLWTQAELCSFWTTRAQTPRLDVSHLFQVLGLDPRKFVVEFKGEWSLPYQQKTTVQGFLDGKVPEAPLDRQKYQPGDKHLMPLLKAANKAGAGSLRLGSEAEKAGAGIPARWNASRQEESLANRLLD